MVLEGLKSVMEERLGCKWVDVEVLKLEDMWRVEVGVAWGLGGPRTPESRIASAPHCVPVMRSPLRIPAYPPPQPQSPGAGEYGVEQV